MGSIPRASVVRGTVLAVPLLLPVEELRKYARSQKTALVFQDETTNARVTYAELESRTNALAKAIAARAKPAGCNRDGDFVVAVCMRPSHNTLMALLAVWKAGAAYVPMEPSFPQARINHILKDAQPSLVIYDESAELNHFSNSHIPKMSFEELILDSSSHSEDVPNECEVLRKHDHGSIAIVLYTSGSTGIPKGVRLPFEAINNRLWWQFCEFPFSETERVCLWKTALTFVDSVCEIWGPLLNERTLLVVPREVTRDPQKLVNVLADNEIHRLVLVPTLLRSILMCLSLTPSQRPLNHLKLWVCSGETLSKELAGEFFKYFGDNNGYKLANFYGSTEVMGDVTYEVLQSFEQLTLYPTIPIGKPIYNCSIYLLNEEDKAPVNEGEIAEIWVAGRNLANGYVGGKAPEKFIYDAGALHPDVSRFYRTGDYGVLEKNVILYAGRTDSQIKIRGHRVDLQEVEKAVNSVEGVEKGVVLCYGLERGNPEILAFVTLQETARLSAQNIEMALKHSLTPYMLPQVIVIETIPLLVNGKVDRQALLKMYENTNNNDDAEIPIEIDYSGVEPEAMDKAGVLFDTIGEVLGRAVRGVLSVRAGFFELGGNSLNSIYTITKLRERGYYIQISHFLEAANLGEILCRMTTSPECEDEEKTMIAEPMKNEDRDCVVDMIVSSFYEKAELEQFLKHEIQPRYYADIMSACWEQLLEANLSVILRNASGTPIAVALNFDARDEPDIELEGGLAKIMAFLEFVEGTVRDTMLPKGKGTVLHSFMMATASSLSPQENVTAIQALEQATFAVAREKGFRGVFTTNTSPLTQQLGTDVLGFKTLLDYQINEYVDSNNERIFGAAPDDARAVVCWKPVQ